MNLENKASKCLFDLIFNDKKEVPIELISDFRNLSKKYNLENYCDYLRDIKLPETLLKSPWEWEFLEKFSKELPENTNVLVLKGASIRDYNLYPIPSLRKSADLDLFIFGLNNYKDQKKFVEFLLENKIIQPQKNWEVYLRKLRNITGEYCGNYIDLHFDLFSRIGNIVSLNRKNKTIEKKMVTDSVPYKGLKNIRKMAYEDLWLFNCYHFLKDFPFLNIKLLVDSYLLLEKDFTSIEKLKKRSEELNLQYLYKSGIFIFSQLLKDNVNKVSFDIKHALETIDIPFYYRKIFNLRNAIFSSGFSPKSRLINNFINALVQTNDNLFLSVVYGFYYFIVNNLISSTIEEKRSTKEFINNLFYKSLYVLNLLKNKFFFRIKLDSTSISESNFSFQILKTNKRLISLELQGLKLTFQVPEEFYEDLLKIWNGYLTEDHLTKEILVEKIGNFSLGLKIVEAVFSEDNVYLKSTNGSYGKVNLNSSGNFYATNFLDVRAFALCLIGAMTFKRDDLLLVHAGAIKIKDQTLIFPGGSSTGKTTFFNLLTKDVAEGINDDTVLLKKEGSYWYAYPTPFMSKGQTPLTCGKSKLTGVIDLVKVCGGHEISKLDKDYSSAILFNNCLGDFTIDDAGFVKSKVIGKIIDLSKQIKNQSQIKFSIKDSDKLIELIKEWLVRPYEDFSFGSNFVRLVELRGTSMEPIFRNGDILAVKEVYPDKLKIKDVICFTNDFNGLPVIHRVKYLFKHEDQIKVVTKGDSCIYEDLPKIFKKEQKLLKVTYKLNGSPVRVWRTF